MGKENADKSLHEKLDIIIERNKNEASALQKIIQAIEKENGKINTKNKLS
jgi:hypothetical protein